MKEYLPSKKLTLIVASLLFVAALVFAADWLGSRKSTDGKLLGVIPGQKINDGGNFGQLIEKDSDEDGLKDWEEALWETDANNPDTDGDGTEDGEEIKLGRNPKIKGPNDELSDEEKRAVSETGTDTSATGAFGRGFFASFMTLKESGDLTPENIQKLSDSIVENFTAGDGNNFTASDLKISSDNSPAALKKYGNEIGAIFEEYLKLKLPDELMIAARAVSSGDRKELLALDKIISANKNLIEKHLTTSVPSKISPVHLKLINHYQTITGAIENMKKMIDDPLTGTIAISRYKKELTPLNNTMTELKNFFINNKIVFEGGEPGRIFNK